MKVCPSCFIDKELKGFIQSSREIGTCDVCKSHNEALLDISELFDFFQELIDNFQLAETGEILINKIQKNWSFFVSNIVATRILNEVLPKLTTDILSSEDQVNYNEDIVENYQHWEVLKEELKWARRFISDIGYLEELGWDGFFNTQFELKPSDKLFRARVHHQSGLPAYKPNEMKCPEPILVDGGRANPQGIPYLYLSDNPETVLYEVRASYLDELSVASFCLEDRYGSVKIVDFTEEIPLFKPSEVNESIKAQLLRKMISQDLSKPMRRYDTDIEYIPTQFICEFIKVFTGASGIRFYSSLHPTGKNVVIFNQELMSCNEVVLQKINSLDLRSEELK